MHLECAEVDRGTNQRIPSGTVANATQVRMYGSNLAFWFITD